MMQVKNNSTTELLENIMAKGDGMEKKWTKRGEVTDQDKLAIEAIVDKNMVSARIFVTGEIQAKSLGKIAASLLYASNDALDEPLFIQTKDATVQMARFDPKEVWACFNPAKLETLIRIEGERFGLGQIPIDEWDYYASMILHLQTKHKSMVVPTTKKQDLDSFYQNTYLGCLWLFDKPGYMAVPASRHFALPEAEAWMKDDFQVRPLMREEIAELVMLKAKYGETQGITNQELNFLLKLHDTEVAR